MNPFNTLNEVFAISNQKKIPKIDRSIGIHCLYFTKHYQIYLPVFSCIFLTAYV